MKYLLILTFITSITLNSGGQNYNVIIDIQIIGYDGASELSYYLQKGNYARNKQIIHPNQDGRCTIIEHIDSIRFFRFYYQSKLDENQSHRCKLIVEPGKHYSIISKGNKTKETSNGKWTEEKYYSPDIYSWSLAETDNNEFFKLDMDQMYYNMFDGDITGSIYNDWDLSQPDSLLYQLKAKIDNRLRLFSETQNNVKNNTQFYEAVKINVEYLLAYQLMQTIQNSWTTKKNKIDDEKLSAHLWSVCDSIIMYYPIDNDKLNLFNLSNRYVDTYLYHYESKKKDSYNAPKKGSWHQYIDEIKPMLNEEVYKEFKFNQTMSNVGNLQLRSAEKAKELLEEYPDLKVSQAGILTENELIPRSALFDSLANRPLSADIIILDEETSINSFEQLKNHFSGKPFLIDFWGTWCAPCRNQFKHKENLMRFLNDNGIEMVYANFEYSPNRADWKKIINAYDLEGYHFMPNDKFMSDLANYSASITGFPTYMIINGNGEIVETKAFLPSNENKLIEQLLAKLNK